jgi:hypothetical protein
LQGPFSVRLWFFSGTGGVGFQALFLPDAKTQPPWFSAFRRDGRDASFILTSWLQIPGAQLPGCTDAKRHAASFASARKNSLVAHASQRIATSLRMNSKSQSRNRANPGIGDISCSSIPLHITKTGLRLGLFCFNLAISLDQ